MSECAEIARLLSDYLDRDLPADTCDAVAAHLQSCEHCSDAADNLRRTVDLCRQYRNESLPGPMAPDKHRELKEAFQRVIRSRS